MVMGRRKKYITEDDKILANRKKSLEFYNRNKDSINTNARKKYKDKKNNPIEDAEVNQEDIAS